MPAPTVISPTIRVNVPNFVATGPQYFPHVVGLANGKIAVVWNTDNGHQIAIMRADGTESAVRTWTVGNGTQAASGSQADIIQLSDGRIVVAWSSNATDASGDINWAYLDEESGNISPTNVITRAGADVEVELAAGLNGRFTLVHNATGTGQDAFRTSYVGFGSQNFGPGEVNYGNATTSAGDQVQPNIAKLADGQFVVVYRDVNDANKIKATFLDGTGARLGGVIEIGTGALAGGFQDDIIGVAGTADGGFVVAWRASGGVAYRKFAADGTATTAQATISGLGVGVSVAALADGRVMIVSAGPGTDNIVGQMISANGALDGGVFVIDDATDTQNQPQVSVLADGRVVVAYSANGVTGGDQRDIVMRIIDPRETGMNNVSASSASDSWTGTAFADFVLMGDGDDVFNAGGGVDFIYGESGNDTLTGDAGNDTLIGGNGNDNLQGGADDDALLGEFGADSLNGGDGNDFLYGGAGADTLTGGLGFDYASYLTATVGVRADLSAVVAGTNDAQGDTFSGVEGLIGSGFNDELYGDANVNWLYGDGGNDYLEGRGGNDVLIGGLGSDYLTGGAGADQLFGEGGFDYANYGNAAAGVTADLGNAALNTGEAAGDTYSGIEGLDGSNFADTLRGDNTANTILGRIGNDTLVGLDGNDYLSGEEDNDVLIGGLGSDQLFGGTGFDYASYAGHLGGLTADLQIAANNTGEAAGDSYATIEGLIGTSFDDSLRGDAQGNWIYGGAGNDFIYGRDGNDVIIGEAGNDYLYGNAGDDLIYGGVGVGNDTYVFGAGDGNDTFYEFQGGAGVGDVILLSTALGVSNFTQVQTLMSQVGGDVRITFGVGTTITIVGTTIGALNADDFGFYT